MFIPVCEHTVRLRGFKTEIGKLLRLVWRMVEIDAEILYCRFKAFNTCGIGLVTQVRLRGFKKINSLYKPYHNITNVVTYFYLRFESRSILKYYSKLPVIYVFIAVGFI